jgi:tetratricopeptide (TPR) repeat protein
MRNRAFGLILLCAGLATAHAADAVNYGSAPAWVKAVATPKDDGAVPDAPARVLLRSYQLRFGASTTEWYVESYIRLQTPQGLQAMSNIVLPWKPDTDVLTVHKCQLLRGDKVIDLLAGDRKFEVMRRENNLEYAALDGMLSATLLPEGGEVGDVLNLAFSIKRESGVIKGPELVLNDFADGPNARIEVRAAWDKSVPMRWRASQDASGAKETRVGSDLEVTWVGEKVELLDQPDNVPARFLRLPEIEFTSYKSWNDVSRTLAPLYAQAVTLAADSPLKAEARAIAAGSPDPVARIEAVLRLVQEKVRYVYLGMGDGNLKPAAADVTWQRRFGDCKGKTSLLIALLREIGIEAEPVAVSTVGGDRIADYLPKIGAFNHVIVRARAGGQAYWLDGAGSGSWRRADLVLPNYRWGLPISARGESLLRMNAAPAEEPAMVTSTFIDARAGIHTDAPFKAEAQFRGATAAALHAQLSQLSAANREQALSSYWSKQYDFVEVKKATSEFDEATGVATLRMEGTAEMDWGGNEYTTDGMRVGLYVDYSRKNAVNADAPFFVEHPAYRIVRQRIELPANGNFSIKGSVYDTTLAGAHHVRTAKLEGRVFMGEAQYRTMASEVSAAEARAAEKQLQAMWKDTLRIDAGDYAVTDADVAALRTRKYTRNANLIWRGNILLRRRDYDAALADFDAAVKADAKDASAMAHRGLARYWKRDMAAAQADFEGALVLDSRQAVALRGLGALYRANGDYKASIEKLSASLQVDDKNTFALTNRAYAYSQLDDQPAALADTAAAIKLDPAAVDMYDLRAWILTTREQKAEAISVVEAMLAANPEDAYAWQTAARNYSRLGDRDKAMQFMDRAIAASPTAGNYYLRYTTRDPDDIPGLKGDLNAALEKDPKYEPALYARAYLSSDEGDHAAAIRFYSEKLKGETNIERNRVNYRLRGIEYAKSGDRANAERDFATSLANDANAADYNNFCWEVAIAKVAPERALAACDKALQMEPDQAAYLDSRGMALLQLGRYEEALAAYDAALVKRPKQPSSLYGRGVAKNRRCRCGDGEADIKAGTAIYPFVVRTFKRAGLVP